MCLDEVKSALTNARKLTPERLPDYNHKMLRGIVVPRWPIVVLLANLLIPAGGRAQTQPPAADTFASRSELVLVPAVVTDKAGAHVRNLTKEEFTVLEDGKPQKLAVFDEERTTASRVQRVPASPGKFSNSLRTESGYRRLVIVALDTVNTPMFLQSNARMELLKFLAQSLDPGEPTELVVIEKSGLRVLHDFTADPAVLVSSLRQITGMSPSLAEKQEVSQGPRPTDGLTAVLHKLAMEENQEKAKMEAFDRHTAILTTLQAMQQIAASVAGVPGRKALLWVSGGFPFSISQTGTAISGDSVLDPYQHTWRLLNQAQVAVYPVDVRALTNPKFHGVDEPGTKHMAWESAGEDPYTDILMRDDTEQQQILTTLENFADATGGRAYFNSNDLQRGFRAAVNDNSSYYMLGYYLNRQGKKPGWHKLQVRVQHSGVEVRARNTFFLTNGASAEDTRSSLAAALSSPVDLTAIAIEGSWTTVSAADGSRKNVGFELVMPANFAEIDQSDRNHLQVQFLAEATTEGQPAPIRVGQTLNLHLDSTGLEQIRSHGMTYRNALKLPPGQYSVRFVVIDALNGRTGTATSDVRVPE